MKRNVILIAGVAAVAVGAVTVAPAFASTKSHTVQLAAASLKRIDTSKTTFVETDTLSNGAKKVGFETQSCNDGGQGVRCSVSFALTDGALLGYETFPITTTSTSTFKGTINGGLGTYKGSRGTFKGTVDGIHAKLTIVYHS